MIKKWIFLRIEHSDKIFSLYITISKTEKVTTHCVKYQKCLINNTHIIYLIQHQGPNIFDTQSFRFGYYLVLGHLI